MTNAPTNVTDLITAVRQRTNTENSQFVTDAEIITMLNGSLAEMDDLLISRYDDYKISSFIYTLSSSNNIPVPDDFLKVRLVERQLSDVNHYQRLKQFSLQEKNRYQYPTSYASREYSTVRYRLLGANIMIEPAEQASGTYQVWYVPDYTVLSQFDTLPAYMDTQAWCEYAVVDTAVKILVKQNLDPSMFMTQKQQLSNRIMSMASNRDAGGVKTIADTRYCNDYSGHNGGW